MSSIWQTCSEREREREMKRESERETITYDYYVSHHIQQQLPILSLQELLTACTCINPELDYKFYHMGCSMQKGISYSQSDQGLCCLLTESFDTIDCISGEQKPAWDSACLGWNWIWEFCTCSKTYFHLTWSIEGGVEPTVNVLIFRTLYSTLFWPKSCFHATVS